MGPVRKRPIMGDQRNGMLGFMCRDQQAVAARNSAHVKMLFDRPASLAVFNDANICRKNLPLCQMASSSRHRRNCGMNPDPYRLMLNEENEVMGRAGTAYQMFPLKNFGQKQSTVFGGLFNCNGRYNRGAEPELLLFPFTGSSKRICPRAHAEMCDVLMGSVKN